MDLNNWKKEEISQIEKLFSKLLPCREIAMKTIWKYSRQSKKATGIKNTASHLDNFTKLKSKMKKEKKTKNQVLF